MEVYREDYLTSTDDTPKVVPIWFDPNTITYKDALLSEYFGGKDEILTREMIYDKNKKPDHIYYATEEEVIAKVNKRKMVRFQPCGEPMATIKRKLKRQ